jgi:hypothetical protein
MDNNHQSIDSNIPCTDSIKFSISGRAFWVLAFVVVLLILIFAVIKLRHKKKYHLDNDVCKSRLLKLSDDEKQYLTGVVPQPSLTEQKPEKFTSLNDIRLSRKTMPCDTTPGPNNNIYVFNDIDGKLLFRDETGYWCGCPHAGGNCPTSVCNCYSIGGKTHCILEDN